MLKYAYFIEPYKIDIDNINIDNFKKAYFYTLNLLDNMNIKHEFQKASEIAYREGIFYGYEYSTDDSYFIQKLDPDYCQITSIEDGVYNFSFDFSYFNKDESLLDNYAPEFKKKYNEYKKAKESKGEKRIGRKDLQKYQWRELSSENSICIKPDETIPFPFPPFVGVLPDVYEIQDYKALKKANTEMENYAILSGVIPYNKTSDKANDFALDLDTAIEFGNKINEGLPSQVGFFLSVYDKMELFTLSKDKVGTDKVEEATNTFWQSAGVTKDLFAGNGSTDAAMKRAMNTDEQIAFSLLRQFERWVNRKLKFNEKKYKFRVSFLDITNFNEDYVINRLQKNATFGIPVKIQLCSALGMSPSSVYTMTFLENDVLGLHDSFIPLQSSHTTANDSPTNGEKGRPSDEQTGANGGDEK